MRIILASESPRRRELLALMGLTFTVVPSHAEEVMPAHAGPDEAVRAIALQKASAVAAAYPDECVIGADTVVWFDGQILGKPHTPEAARAYLSRMQGRTHTVYTGVAVIAHGWADVRHETTRVTFAPMSALEIDRYVASGDPLDKAGAYGVQGPFAVYVDRIEGNYFNVIGMPLPLLYRMLREAGALPEAGA